MLYTVIKNHRVEGGETSSSVKFDTLKDALQNYYQYAANYMADRSVVAWSLAVVETDAGEDMRIIELSSYTKEKAE